MKKKILSHSSPRNHPVNRSRAASSTASDGYVNHGFSDASTTNGVQQNGPPLAQLAKFRFDLVGVKAELLQLQELVSLYGLCSRFRLGHAADAN